MKFVGGMAVLASLSVLLAATRLPLVAAAAVSTKETDGQDQCVYCHQKAVEGFARSKMAQSMRLPDHEPEGMVRAPEATLRMYSNHEGTWQSVESQGVKETYRIDYVIGSGTHASGYIISLSNHLFQSPVAYYRRRRAYGLAPGYETESDPDFTRPVKAGCLFCHAGGFAAVSGSVNEYAAQPFSHLAVSCSRCHGPVSKHLANPGPSTIINPANLDPVSRDSVCEQCHLKGVARVLNPGRKFTDFVVGQPLEKTFTTYIYSMPDDEHPPFKVISHSEELALSRCKRVSGSRMWCGTCHDPHHEPVDPVSYYRAKCLTCHAATHFGPRHPPRTSNCIGCHMPKREANDGGHTVFTDHRIQRTPDQKATGEPTGITAWRSPPSELAKRNLGMGLIEVGTEERSWPQIVSGYRTLTEVQHQFADDADMYQAMGNALFIGGKYSEAVIAFGMAVQFDPKSSSMENSLGSAYAALGKNALAETHFEQALVLDSMNLSAAEQLINLYEKDGARSKADVLRDRLIRLFP